MTNNRQVEAEDSRQTKKLLKYALAAKLYAHSMLQVSGLHSQLLVQQHLLVRLLTCPLSVHLLLSTDAPLLATTTAGNAEWHRGLMSWLAQQR